MTIIPNYSTCCISSNNTTSNILKKHEIFIGSPDDIMNYSYIIIICNTDISSIKNNLSMEFSLDGINWDKKMLITITSGQTIYRLNIISQYFRVVYKNGFTNQSHFRLQTIYQYHSKSLYNCINNNISNKHIQHSQSTKPLLTPPTLPIL
jgi:hypothetical protein